jgi:hypothetical protein
MASLQSRRRSLLTIVIAGSIVTALVAAGVFAVFSDRATTGANALESPEIAAAVDLQLASLTGSGGCGTFVDDLETGLFSVTDDLGTLLVKRVCLRNAGSESTQVALSTLDLVDVDFACTGNELGSDPNCGDDQGGELSSALQVMTGAASVAQPCGSVDENSNDSFLPDAPVTAIGTLDSLTDNSVPSLGDLAPNETICVLIAIQYAPLVQTQSDRVTWRFAFDGVPPQTPSCVDDELDPLGTNVTASGSWQGVICPGLFDQFSAVLENGESLTADLSYVNADGDLDLIAFACPIDGTVCDEGDALSDSDTEDTEGVVYTNTTGEQRVLYVIVAGHDVLHNTEPFTITNSYTLSFQL